MTMVCVIINRIILSSLFACNISIIRQNVRTQYINMLNGIAVHVKLQLTTWLTGSYQL